jgi:EAL domain-containing protein (putative c-di-GMP-specific phosphodiesterase class I)
MAETVAETLLHTLERPVLLDGREIFAGASMGIAISPQDGEDAQELMRNADAAMYHAKSRGKNQFHFFTSDLNRSALQRLELDSELRRALERNEFQVHYQPIIDNCRRHVLGGEALLRWQNPRFGSVSPAEFIPLAEDTGLIHSIGRWVLEEACRAAVTWGPDAATGPYVTVNVSSHQIQQAGFPDIVRQALKNSGLAATRLVLELTESAILGTTEQVAHNISALRKEGVRFALDDFGTGYSSLSSLRRHTFDVLKIDQSFVNGIVSNPDDEALVRAMISMAQNLQLSVVAEGVEASDQYKLLSKLGTQASQGWLFARALPNYAFLTYLHSDASAAS